MAKKNEELQLDDSVKQNSKGQVILGQLYGPCADFINPTRNGRKYDESLWEKVFNDPIVNEYFEAGGIPGELDHPADRLETCSEKIAIMMPEKPTKDSKGNLIAKFDILDTPNGRIAYTLAKYGYRLGISSRGGGDIYKGIDGQEHVDEDTYDFHGFDLVLLPAVKAARLQLAESLQNSKTFKVAINESLSKATEDEKRVMVETLNNLNIDYTHENAVDKKSDIAANDVGANMVKELQDSLLAKQKLENEVTELQEKLSVCYAKEAKLEEDLNKYKSAVQNLSSQVSNVKSLQQKVQALGEELSKVTKQSNDKSKLILENQRVKVTKEKSLNEALSKSNVELKNANAEIKRLNESISIIKAQSDERYNQLNEQLAEQKKNLSLKSSEYTAKLSNANKLVEQLRKTAKTAVNKYVESQAVRLGVKSSEIFEKLPRNYSFADIDSICEELSEFKLNVSNLPFNLSESKVKINESIQAIPLKPRLNDDEVDASLMTLAKLN